MDGVARPARRPAAARRGEARQDRDRPGARQAVPRGHAGQALDRRFRPRKGSSRRPAFRSGEAGRLVFMLAAKALYGEPPEWTTTMVAAPGSWIDSLCSVR